MKHQIRFALLIIGGVALLSGCIPGLFEDTTVSYRCVGGDIATVDYATSPPTVVSGGTVYRLVRLQANGRWTTEGFLEEISITDEQLTFHEIGGLVNFVCNRV